MFAVTFSGLLFQLTAVCQNCFFGFISRHIVVNTVNGIDLAIGIGQFILINLATRTKNDDILIFTAA